MKINGSINQNMAFDWIEIDSSSSNQDENLNQISMKVEGNEIPKYLFAQKVEGQQFMK